MILQLSFSYNLYCFILIWANLHSANNNVTAIKTDSNSIQVTLNEWGRWFWVNDQGAIDYETENYKVDFDNLNHSYIVTFIKLSKSDDVIIYFTPEGWKEFNLTTE